MNLHAREMSPSSRVPKNNKKKVIPQQGSLGAKAVHSRSNGINEDGIASGSTSPAAETEQGRTDAQVVHIIDKEEMSDSSAVSNPQSRPSPKQATRRDALKVSVTEALTENGFTDSFTDQSHDNGFRQFEGSEGPPTSGNDYGSKTIQTQGFTSLSG